jgi:hypothetical protein
MGCAPGLLRRIVPANCYRGFESNRRVDLARIRGRTWAGPKAIKQLLWPDRTFAVSLTQIVFIAADMGENLVMHFVIKAGDRSAGGAEVFVTLVGIFTALA